MNYLPYIAGAAALGLAARRGRRKPREGLSYFSASWSANAEEEARAYKTKELFAYMPPEEFLALAEPFSREGESPSKRENVLRLLTENTRFRDGPALSFDETGQVYGHEGRHRVTALLRMGVARIPVLLRARGGTGIRWGEQDDPTAWGYNKNLPSWLLSEKPGNRPPHERAAWRQKRVAAPWYTRGPERGQLRPEYRVPSTGRTARRGRRATQTCTEGRTDPDLWAKVKKEVTAGSKGGRSGQWSARKAQMAVQAYKAEGGTYCGPKTKAQRSLARWTKEKWGSDRKGDRYLPKKAREALTDAEYRRTSAKKRRDTAKGKQFSKQPPKIAKKTAKHRGRRAETYPWLSLAKIKKYEQLMRDRGVSEVARSPRGFLTAYKRAGSKTRLSPEWRMKRDGFVARHWTQAQKQARPLYETKGKYAGTPTRWHLALIAWGFSPDGAKGL